MFIKDDTANVAISGFNNAKEKDFIMFDNFNKKLDPETNIFAAIDTLGASNTTLDFKVYAISDAAATKINDKASLFSETFGTGKHFSTTVSEATGAIIVAKSGALYNIYHVNSAKDGKDNDITAADIALLGTIDVELQAHNVQE